MPDDYVIDTNVWVMVDRNIADITSITELNCLQACVDWLRQFRVSEDRLVIDANYRILREYRNNIAQGGTAITFLSRLEAQPRSRLVEYYIEFDQDNYAVLPDTLHLPDKEDRKFVAVALAHTPTPPIVYSTDTDWHPAEPTLTQHGISLKSLCPDYIREKLARETKT